MSCEKDEKKLRPLNSSIEDLSNELIYEIFDYFDACEIFKQFRNLNQRFDRMILHSNLPLRVRCSSTEPFEQIYQQMILPNIHRVVSLHLLNRAASIMFSTLCTIDASFCRLESLILHKMESNELLSILPKLMVLPRLIALKVVFLQTLNNPNEIYRLIFQLPGLKSIQLSAYEFIPKDFMSVTDDGHSNSIEHLVMDHFCTPCYLYDVLSHTPNLRRLTCKIVPENNEHFLTRIPLRLSHLTYCSIRLCTFVFDKFEVLIKKFFRQLRVLHFNVSSDATYVNANRWERLISQHMPYLHSFQFQCSELNDRSDCKPYQSLLDRFTCPFWIDRGWILSIRTNLTHWPWIEIIYLIQTCRENISFSEQKSMDVSKFRTQLTVQCCHLGNYDHYFFDSIQFITSLRIEFNYFSLDVLLQFLSQLPNLDSLTIVFIDLNPIQPLTQDQIDTIPKMDKVTKMSIEPMVDLTYVDVLMNLCPQIECLQVECRDYAGLESILRLILMKRESTLSSICFRMTAADDWMVNKLQAMIHFEKLLMNYTIHRIVDRIVLKFS